MAALPKLPVMLMAVAWDDGHQAGHPQFEQLIEDPSGQGQQGELHEHVAASGDRGQVPADQLTSRLRHEGDLGPGDQLQRYALVVQARLELRDGGGHVRHENGVARNRGSVGGGRHDADAVGHGDAGHLQGLVQPGRPVVEPRQDVAVQVDQVHCVEFPVRRRRGRRPGRLSCWS